METISAIENIIATASKANEPTEGDYIGDNGLLYCGNCHTPKQCRMMFMGEENTVLPLTCKCRLEAYQQRQAEFEKCERERRICKLLTDCFPAHSDYASMTFENSDDTDSKLMKAAMNYCEKFSEFRQNGKGLLLYGGCGVGKSHLAACIANRLISQSVRVKFTTMPKIVNQLQGSFEGRERLFDELRGVSLLVIDDFKSERSTEFMQEAAYEVINGRSEAHLPLIVTTNLTNAELKAHHDIQTDRVLSRLLGMTIPIEMTGLDRRREKIKADYAADRAMLGL